MSSIGYRSKVAFASALVGLAGIAGAGHSVAASVNLLPGNWQSITISGAGFLLRAGSQWVPGTLFTERSIVDGNFLPQGTTWNIGSWWWDEHPSVNPSPVLTFIKLQTAFSFDRFVIQADDNDVYQIDYWNGSTWLPAYTAAAIGPFGMQTRDSGLLAPITTDQLRIMASGGDGYYSFSEIQAFSTTVVPVPGALLLFATGAGVFGVAARRRRAHQ